MINSCIVGFGAIGPLHAKAVDSIDNANVYAVCDTESAKADMGAEQFNAKPYYNLDDALNDPAIDVMHICTPHYLHSEMIQKALKAGKKVLTEKPVTMLKSEFEDIADTDICVMFQNRTNNCIKTLKDIISTDKSLGSLIGAKGIVMWHRGIPYYNSPWRGKKSTEGGGVLINQAIHTLDLLSFLCGDIKSVKAVSSNMSLKNVIDTEDTLNAYITFKNDAVGAFYATNSYSCDSSNIIEIQFENALFRYVDSFLYKIGTTSEIITTDDVNIPGKKYWGSGHKNIIEEYYQAIDKKSDNYLKISDVKNSMRSMFAMYESAERNGEEVNICS